MKHSRKQDRRKDFDPLEWEFLAEGRRATDWTASFALGLLVIFVGHWLWDVGSAVWLEGSLYAWPDVAEWWADLGKSIGQWLGGNK